MRRRGPRVVLRRDEDHQRRERVRETVRECIRDVLGRGEQLSVLAVVREWEDWGCPYERHVAMRVAGILVDQYLTTVATAQPGAVA